MTRYLPLLCLLAACRCNDTGDTSVSETETDTDQEDTGDSGDTGAPCATLTGTIEGATATVILEVRDLAGGVERFELEGDTFSLCLPEGPVGVRVWADEDGDGTWDGTWEGEGEPTALLGLTLPRHDLRLVLRRGVPEPILDESPELVELYHVAWGLAEEHIARGTTANGFADAYMDEAFSAQIFQWDSVFMTLFGHHGVDAFPVMATLDNFYGTQAADGYICRVVNETDGQPGGDASDPSEPMVNPPLFAWSELRYARRTGDLSRLPEVIPVLEAYADWMDAHLRTGTGLYYTSMLGSGMDNAPRDLAYDGWVDISAQQALARRQLAELHSLIGTDGSADLAEAERICADVRTLTWDADEGWFFDLGPDQTLLTEKNLAGIWPLVAGCATTEQQARVVAHLRDPAEFWRVHPFPSTSADAPSYDRNGHYWRGGVWAPTTYATLHALQGAGRRDLARLATQAHLRNLSRVYRDFRPAPGQIADDEGGIGDGIETLWELYAPDEVAPGTRWDATWLGRQDFVGWTGLGPIAGLVEVVIGLEPDAPADTLTWHLHRTDRHGIQGYRFGDQLVDLVVAPRDSADQEAEIEVSSSGAFTLVVEEAGRTWSFDVPAGESTLTVPALDSVLAADLVQAGPVPGYAILGNGRIAAVISDDDGSADPPGLLHLYRGDFATDLVEVGQTLVGQGGVRMTERRVGLDPFFAAYSEVPLPDGGTVAWRSFVGEHDAVVAHGALVGGESGSTATVAPLVQLRESPHMDGLLSIDSLSEQSCAGRTCLMGELSDGTALVLASTLDPASWTAGTLSTDPVAGGLDNTVGEGRQLVLSLDLVAAPGVETPFRWVLATGDSAAEALSTAETLLSAADPLADAEDHWAVLAPQRYCDGPHCPTAAANLYAARASSLGGQVPADLTGQFVTHDRPQLYPRDALMVARAMHLIGLDDEAWEIVHYWLSDVPDHPRAGEWYARYDALGRGVDAGTGAAFDEPEYDANGYLALLVEDLGPSELDATERQVLLEGLDFLVAAADADGLYTEGGIVEWTGRLPATAMSNHEGLLAGARLAEAWAEEERAADYRATAALTRAGLVQLLEWEGLYLADQRDGGLAYDTSLLFGPAWGYPHEGLLDHTHAWILDNTRHHGGGVRYFEGLGYGQDLFWFTTSATAQYSATLGDTWTAEALVDWMIAFSNRYGLAPERLYADGSGAAEATPLSWCAAELGVAILSLEEAWDRSLTPVSDGVVDPGEYRPWGAAVVDEDGVAGAVDALYAAQDGADLWVGLRGEGTPDAVYIAPEDGEGPLDLGLPWRGEPGATGAAGRIWLDGGCSLQEADASGFSTVGSCSAVQGVEGLEVHVDLSLLGLDTEAVQLIADLDEPVPAWGSLLTAEHDTVWVDFSVVASHLDPSETLTLSGDRAELGAWTGHAVPLQDPDGDGTWEVSVQVERGGTVSFKHLTGDVSDPSWEGVEFEGDDRVLYVDDVNGTGRVWVHSIFGTRDQLLLDP